MLDHEDMKWLAATATALNGFMQKATRQVEMARLCKGGGENLDALNEQIELASRASQAIFDRITTRILARTTGGVGPGEANPATSASAARASVSTKIPLGEVAANADAASDALILNPKGERELIRLCKGGGENLDALDEQIELASRASQAIFDRITTRILARTTGGVRPGEANPATSASADRASVSTKIPLGEVAANADAASDALILNPKGERELILLVDDDQDVLKCTGEILDFEDYRFILAKDGIEALQIYQQMGGKIDLVLLDYFLPVMDGDAVFDELKAIDPKVRVVLSSGFAEQAKVGSMLARGLQGFIPKPYTREKLIEQIRSVLDA